MLNKKKEQKKKRATILMVQNVKGTIKIDNIGGQKNGKKRS